MVFGRKLFGGIRNAVGGTLGNNMGQQQTMPYQPAIGMPGGQGGQTTYQNPNPQVGGPSQLGGNEFSTAPAVQPYSPSDARPTLLRPQMTMPYQPGDMGGNMGGRFGSNQLTASDFGRIMAGSGGQLQTSIPTPMSGDMGGGEYSPNPMGGLERPQVGYFGGSTAPIQDAMYRPQNPTLYGGQPLPTPLPTPYMPGIGGNMGEMVGGVENNYRGIGGLVNATAPAPAPYMSGINRFQNPTPSEQPQISLQTQQQAMQQAIQQVQARRAAQGDMGQQPMALAGLLNTMPNQTPAGLAGLLGAVPTAPTVSMAARPLSAMPRLPAKAPAVRPSMVRAAPKLAIKKLIKKR